MAEKKSEELASTAKASESLAPRPDYIKANDKRGLEGITKRDMLIPRLALAQAMSPEVTEGDPKRIDGLKVGDLFNSVTNEVYGREVFVQVIRIDELRAMEFLPNAGGVKDPNVPLTVINPDTGRKELNPLLKWGENGEKPIATLFRDFLAILLPSRELIALSFKSSGDKVARRLNGLIALRGTALFTGRYRITTGVELKPKPHQVYKVANADWVSEADAQYGEMMYDAVKDMDLGHAIQRDLGDDDHEYDPNTVEAELASKEPLPF